MSVEQLLVVAAAACQRKRMRSTPEKKKKTSPNIADSHQEGACSRARSRSPHDPAPPSRALLHRASARGERLAYTIVDLQSKAAPPPLPSAAPSRNHKHTFKNCPPATAAWARERKHEKLLARVARAWFAMYVGWRGAGGVSSPTPPARSPSPAPQEKLTGQPRNSYIRATAVRPGGGG